MDWWLWVLLGLGLLALEMATPGGFFALFFGKLLAITNERMVLQAVNFYTCPRYDRSGKSSSTRFINANNDRFQT